MTGLNQSKFPENKKANWDGVTIPHQSDIARTLINSDPDVLAQGKESLRIERLGLLEDQFVQSVCKEKGIIFLKQS